MRYLVLLLTTALTIGSAQRFENRFTLIKTTTLAAASEKLTVQQPASGAKSVFLLSASVYCSVACTATMTRDGTAATTTALTPVAISGIGAPATTTTGYHTSNVGAGTTISVAHVIPAGATVVFDLSGIHLRGNGTAKNFSIATNSITGDAKIQIIWREE